MSTDKKHVEPSSTDLDAELREIDADLDAQVAALAEWDEKNAAGEDVDPSEKPKRRGLVELLRDRRTNAVARKARAERRERLHTLTELRCQIEAEEAQDAEEILALYRKAQDAARAFRARTDARTARLHGHQAVMARLGVPNHVADALTPSPEHAELGWTPSGQLAVGDSRLRIADGQKFLNRMVVAVEQEAGGAPDGPAAMAQIERELSELRHTVQRVRGGRYFVNSHNAIWERGPDGVGGQVSPDLREITAAEADQLRWAQNEKRRAG